MPRRLLIASLCAILSLNCSNPEKRRLQNRLAELEAQRASLVQRLTDRHNGIASSKRLLEGLRADLAKSNGETEAFLTDHKMATACIGAAAVSLGDDFCALALTEEAFAAEVAAVAD